MRDTATQGLTCQRGFAGQRPRRGDVAYFGPRRSWSFTIASWCSSPDLKGSRWSLRSG